ncbi:MAG TPA: hypothetical protein VMY37_22910 [Thermoguttaceae bacterium]|nr:hypothetical protein [Thermoguttaceae bacterium]
MIRQSVYLSVSGGLQLQKNLAELPVKVQRRVVRSSVNKVARLMVKAAKNTMETERKLTDSPQTFDTGLLKKSIGFRSWTSKTGSWIVGATIGPRKGFGTLVVRNKRGKNVALTKRGIDKHVAAGGGTRSEYADPAKYGHLVEGGSKRARHGTVPERPFMEHTLIRSHVPMGAELRTALAAGIQREAMKLKKV